MGIKTAAQDFSVIANVQFTGKAADRVAQELFDAAFPREVASYADSTASADFCKVSPDICKGNLGLPRIKMPQITEDVIPDFVEYLKEEEGINARKKTVPMSTLKATQREINADKAEAIAQKMMKGNFPPNPAIIISKDKHILDGHHRWAAGLLTKARTGKDVKVDVIEVGLPIRDLLEAAYEFPKTTYAGF